MPTDGREQGLSGILSALRPAPDSRPHFEKSNCAVLFSPESTHHCDGSAVNSESRSGKDYLPDVQGASPPVKFKESKALPSDQISVHCKN